MYECKKTTPDNPVGTEKDVAFEHVPSIEFPKARRALEMGVFRWPRQCPCVGKGLMCVGMQGLKSM